MRAWPWGSRDSERGPVRPEDSTALRRDGLDPAARLGRAHRRPPAGDPGRTHPIDLNGLVEPFVGPVLVGLAAAIVVLLLLALVQARSIRRLGRRLDAFTRGAAGGSADPVLRADLDKVLSVARELDELSARSAIIEASGQRAIQRVGLVRFNPFEDTGGNQSFALALIDGAGSGIVVSSLHSRTGTRLYAKTVTASRSDGALSTEEQEALQQALARPLHAVPGSSRGPDRAAGSA